MNKSTLKTLEILELIAMKEKGITISQIAKELVIPRSSVNDIIKALLVKKYLYCDDENLKTYTLGNKIFELSLKVKGKKELLDILNPFLNELVKEFNETVFFGLKDADEILYLSKIESLRSIRTTAVLGSRKGLYYTGLGKAILSTYTDIQLKDYIKRVKLEKETEYTITDSKILIKDILETKERGYSIERREGDESVACVGAPIFQKGKILGAISISGLYLNFDNKNLKIRGEKVKEIARKISEILG